MGRWVKLCTTPTEQPARALADSRYSCVSQGPPDGAKVLGYGLERSGVWSHDWLLCSSSCCVLKLSYDSARITTVAVGLIAISVLLRAVPVVYSAST